MDRLVASSGPGPIARRGRIVLGASRSSGLSLPELLLALVLLGLLAVPAATGFRRWRDSASLHAAARSARSHLALARRLAISRRETVRVRATSDDDLVLLDSSDRILALAAIGRRGDIPVDSVRLRPSTLRFNSRGQAAPGSVYVFGRRGSVRLVCNFLGRVRQETVRKAG